MKVLMQGRVELFECGGGDKIQIENTARELRKLGVEVEVSTSFNKDLAGFDLVHVFQLDWSPESYLFSRNAKKAGKPLVLSPIHHSVEEVKRFDESYTFGFRRLAKLLLREQHQRDTLKNIYRSFFNPKKIYPTLYSVVLGLKGMHTKTLTMADIVLVQTEAEANDLHKTYGVSINWEKIPNGVADQFSNVGGVINPFDFKDYIICVGRIEPRKNQLRIIEAVEKLRASDTVFRNAKVVFIGKKSRNHIEYIYRFTKKLGQNSWIVHLNEVPYSRIPAYYKFAKVGVSASWFETTGLTSLEAVFCGTNAVASGERAREYLGDLASYCDPGDVASIQRAIQVEYFKKRPVPTDEMKKEWTWESAAKKTLEAYNKVL